jgi:hypothetical protein
LRWRGGSRPGALVAHPARGIARLTVPGTLRVMRRLLAPAILSALMGIAIAGCSGNDSVVLPRDTTTTRPAVATTHGVRRQVLLCHEGQVAVQGSDGVNFCATPAVASSTVPGPDGRYYYDGPCPAGQVPSPLLAPPNCVAAKTST